MNHYGDHQQWMEMGDAEDLRLLRLDHPRWPWHQVAIATLAREDPSAARHFPALLKLFDPPLAVDQAILVTVRSVLNCGPRLEFEPFLLFDFEPQVESSRQVRFSLGAKAVEWGRLLVQERRLSLPDQPLTPEIETPATLVTTVAGWILDSCRWLLEQGYEDPFCLPSEAMDGW